MPTDSNPPTDNPNQDTNEIPSLPESNEPEINKTKLFKDWDTLRHDLAPTPEAADLLDTYGKPAWESLEHDLNRHPYLEARDTFNQAYAYALWHRTLTAARDDNTLTDHTYKGLENITGIPWGRIRDWTLGEKTPHLERTIHIHEAARQHWETQLPHETKDHLLDPSFVYNTLKPLLDHPEQQTPEHLATAIETLYHQGSTQHLTIAELKPYHKIGPQDLRTIAQTITDHQNQITNLLNQRLNLSATQEELHLAVENDTLYLWHKTTNPDYWPNALKDELLYLKPHVKDTLIEATQRHLNVNKTQLGQLIDQLTNHPRENLEKPRTIPYELWPTKYSTYLYGDTLHLLLDTNHQPFTTIKPHITQIGRIANPEKGGGIQNPTFPEGKHLNDLRARLVAIALSDCHINKNTHVLTYHKNDLERMDYGQNLFNQLGECTYRLEQLKGERYRLTVSAPVGRLLENWGVPRGDKHLHPDLRLPKAIRKGSNEVKCAYIAEVIPEDGFFVDRNGQLKFGIKRTTILDAGPKAEIYNFQQKITDTQKDFIYRYGKKQYQTIRDDKPRRQITLTKGRLEQLKTEANTKQDQKLADELIATIISNPCQLLKDEKELIQSLGIRMQDIFKEIHLYETERVSAVWEIYTDSNYDTRLWADIALPSSGEKRVTVLEWLSK
jgi:hypothetical protein